MQYKKDLKNVLLKQYALYPKMQTQDMVKLIYQNEFGGGHLIADEADSLNRLSEEYRMIRRHSSGVHAVSAPLFEDIGSGLCRLHLRALADTQLNLSTVNRFFILSAASVHGDRQSLLRKLEVFRQCIKDRLLPYPAEVADAYLKEYKNRGCPPVSHSDIYRGSYSPSYRVVKDEFRDFLEVFSAIDSLLKTRDSIVVAIDGNCGAGKSTLAELLSAVYDLNVFHMDHFFLTPVLRTQERLNEAGGNIDYERFEREVISGLKSGQAFLYRIYDCKNLSFGQPVSVTPKRLNIIEGVYSMHPALTGNYDLKIFMEIGKREQALRIKKRNGVSMQKRFLCEWIPLENRYFQEFGIKAQSDLVLRG